MSRLGLLLALVVIALLAFAGISFRHATSSTASALTIDATDLFIGDVPSEVPIDVAFTLRNTSDRPLRILGGSSRCTVKMCHKPKRDGETVIPPYGEVQHVCEIVLHPGPFDSELDLYLEDLTGLRTVALRVRGVGVER